MGARNNDSENIVWVCTSKRASDRVGATDREQRNPKKVEQMHVRRGQWENQWG